MSYKKLDKETLNIFLKELANNLKKQLKGKSFSYEIIVVGGASIVLNYSFRKSTIDVDCLDINDALMNEVVNKITDKYNLPNDWINTDFIHTSSYSPRLIEFSSFYKSFANDTLIVRTIKDEYLIAMKLRSARKYKHDFSDIYGIVLENNNNPSFSLEKCIQAYSNLYGKESEIDQNALSFLKDVFNNKELKYKNIVDVEKDNEKQLLVDLRKQQNIAKNLKEGIDDIKHGNVKDASQVLEEIIEKYGL